MPAIYSFRWKCDGMFDLKQNLEVFNIIDRGNRYFVFFPVNCAVWTVHSLYDVYITYSGYIACFDYFSALQIDFHALSLFLGHVATATASFPMFSERDLIVPSMRTRR